MQKDIKEEYLNALRQHMRGLFSIIKQGHAVPETEKRYTEGFMQAGKILGVSNKKEFKSIFEEVNQEVFGMSLKERKEKYPNAVLKEEDVLDLPTYLRKGIRLSDLE